MTTDTDIAIRVQNLSKCYQIYGNPSDRLKQFIYPKIKQLLGKPFKPYFREFWALNDVSFEVKRGETVGIIGRNGSGKSTLLQIICGTLAPTGGQVQIQGRVAALLELGSGFNPEFTGRENVYLNASVLGLSTEEIDQRYDAIAAFADIGDFINQPVKTYSSGMTVRLAFAVQSQVDPDILIVDEALAVGDEAFQRKCFSRIEAIRDNGGTILFVSHSAQTVIQLCNRAILLDAGEALVDGKPKAAVLQYQKLLNANKDHLKAAREEIKQRKVEQSALATEQNNAMQIIAAQTTEQNADFFDATLQSKTMVSSPTLGAEIIDFKIYSLAGQRINVLQTGKQYKIEIKIRFDEDIRLIDTGFAVKTPNGLILCGVSTQDTAFGVQSIASKHEAVFSFKFTCSFNVGIYFAGFSVYGVRNRNDKELLHRITDALVFRVAPEYGQLAKGYFDLESSLSYVIKPAAHS